MISSCRDRASALSFSGLHPRDSHQILSFTAGSSSEPMGFALGLPQHAQRIAFGTFGQAASLGLGLFEEVLGRGPGIGAQVFGVGPARSPLLLDLGHRFGPPTGRIRRCSFPHTLGCYPSGLEHIADLMTEGGKFGAQISFGELAEASGECGRAAPRDLRVGWQSSKETQ